MTAFCRIHLDYRNYYASFSDRKPVSVNKNKFRSARLDKIRLVTGFEPFRPDAPRPLDGPFVPHNLMSSQRSPVHLLKFRMVPRPRLITSSGSKKKEPKRACLSEATASHSHKMWVEVFSSASHLLHRELFISPVKHCVTKGMQ